MKVASALEWRLTLWFLSSVSWGKVSLLPPTDNSGVASKGTALKWFNVGLVPQEARLSLVTYSSEDEACIM